MQDESTTREIPLTQGYVAIVDADDYEYLSQFKWTALVVSHTVYAYRKNKRRTEYMHRVVAGAARGQEVDHIDRNGLNNRKANLRLASRRQQMLNRGMSRKNRSGYRGVHRSKGAKKWAAQINIDGKTVHLGSFSDKEEAAKAYDAAAKQYHGEYAQLNFG